MAPFNPLPVEPTFTTWHGHQIAHYRAGSGPPALLVHSINAAASAFEMRGPFKGLQDSFEVHAIDLLGFGRSDRPARRYSADDYIDQIDATLAQLDAPAVVIASTLGAAYAVKVAARRPERVRALVLVCPVGISLLSSPPGPAAAFTYSLLRGPVGAAVFQGLTTRASMTYFVKYQTYGDPDSVSEETFAGFYDAAHQPGAMHAPICFVSGLLNCDISHTFGTLTQPVLIVWGRKAAITKVSQADEFLARNPAARLVIFEESGMIAQDEQPEKFNALVKDFVNAQA